AGEKSLATSDVSGILNAPALNPLRRVFYFNGVNFSQSFYLTDQGLLISWYA
ncbi:hypothetical protein ECPA38_1199, partial [Escherichia coli PA38]